MRVRHWAALAGQALVLGCAPGTAGSSEAVADLRIETRPVEIAPDKISGMRLLHAVQLSAAHRAFGGMSGLLVENGRLTAVTDSGWLLQTALETGDRLRLGSGEFAPLPGASGAGGKSTSDAESLARPGDGLAVGFERDHRIEVLAGGRAVREIRDRRFERMGSNEGLEALASLPDGRLIAIGEAAIDGAFPVFVAARDGTVSEGALPKAGPHEVTGADVGPDGRLYVLRRDFSIFRGLSVLIERYWLDEAGLPRPETRDVLASFQSAGGIDNMEGIALWREAQGATRLAVISDNNHNPIQRTLLLVFELAE